MVRARMPHNNRVTAGNALRTTDIWTKTIGHNPVSVIVLFSFMLPIPIIPAIKSFLGVDNASRESFAGSNQICWIGWSSEFVCWKPICIPLGV